MAYDDLNDNNKLQIYNNFYIYTHLIKIELEILLWGKKVSLLPEKALWYADNQTLIISDLHVGKVEHFRKAGISIPAAAAYQTTTMLHSLISKYTPKEVIFLGDLFHSVENSSLIHFTEMLQHFENCTFRLISGNHDIMEPHVYHQMNLIVHNEWIMDNIWLTHEPQAEIKPGFHNLAGHIHPCIILKGKGKQSLSLPCFYFTEANGIMPAFGYFTGKGRIKIDKKTDIFAVADGKIFRIDP